MPPAVVLIQGMCAATALAVGLCFLRFWQDSRDRLFLYFAMAFWLMSSCWVILGVVARDAEGRPYVYVLRLLAFLLVIAAIVDKNRGRGVGRWPARRRLSTARHQAGNGIVRHVC